MNGSSQTQPGALGMGRQSSHDEVTPEPFLDAMEIESEPQPRRSPPELMAVQPDLPSPKTHPNDRTITLSLEQRDSLRRRLNDAASTVQCYRGDLVELTKTSPPPPSPQFVVDPRSIHSAPTRIVPSSSVLDQQVEAAWKEGGGPQSAWFDPMNMQSLAVAASPRQSRWGRRLLIAAACAAGLAAFGMLGQWAGTELVVHSIRGRQRSSVSPNRHPSSTDSNGLSNKAEISPRTASGQPLAVASMDSKDVSGAAPPIVEKQPAQEIVADASPSSHKNSDSDESAVDTESPARFLWAESDTLVMREKPPATKRTARARSTARHRTGSAPRARKAAKREAVMDKPTTPPPSESIEQLIERVPTREPAFSTGMTKLDELDGSPGPASAPAHR